MHEWTEDAFVRAFFDWAVRLMGRSEWDSRRRAVAAFATGRDALPHIEGATSGSFLRSAVPSDRAAWYLYQCELYLFGSVEYDMAQGSRIIPIVHTLGRGIDVLQRIPGADRRLARALRGADDVIDSTLFEMLAALAYATRAWREVKFIDEDPRSRSPDISVLGVGGELLVECKRKRYVSDYLRRERERLVTIIAPLSAALERQRLDWCIDIVFHRPIVDCGEDILERRLVALLPLASPGILVDDHELTVRIISADWDILRSALRRQDIRADTFRIPSLLFGRYEPWKGLTALIKGTPRPDSVRYMRTVEWAAAILTSCDAEDDMRIKVRHFGHELADAVAQLPPQRPAAIHIGAESYEGAGAEDFRHQRIIDEMMRDFDFRDRDVRAIYCHLYYFEIPPDDNWAVREKCHYILPTGDRNWLLEPQTLLAGSAAEGVEAG